MTIESRTIVGAASAFAVVGAAVWMTLAATTPSTHHVGSVQIQQIEERSWTVEVKDLDASKPVSGIVKTASTR